MIAYSALFVLMLTMMDFCDGVQHILEKWPTRPTSEQLKLDVYFPVATARQQSEAGYQAGARPGLPAFLSESCLDWAYAPLTARQEG